MNEGCSHQNYWDIRLYEDKTKRPEDGEDDAFNGRIVFIRLKRRIKT